MRSACQIAVAGLVATQSVRGYQFRVLDSSTMYECGAVALEWTAGGTPPFSVSVFVSIVVAVIYCIRILERASN